MKKFFYSFALLFVFGSTLLFAQNFGQKGVWEFGGGAGFSSITGVFDGESADESITTFMFEPYVGYFVINSLELGLIPSFETTSFGDVSTNSFGVYFAPAWNFDLKSNVFPFIEGRVGYNTSSYDDGDGTTEDPSSSGLAWGGRGGAKFKLGNSALVNASIGYTQVTMDPENWDGGRIGYNGFDVMVGFTVFVGR